MEELKKLVKIVTIFSPKKISLLDPGNEKPRNKEEKLFLNIQADKYENDDDAYNDLYKNGQEAYRYRMLKSRLREKLLNQLFFVRYETRLTKRDEKKCLDLMYRGKVLLIMAEYPISKKLYLKALKIAEKYEFTDFTIECLNNLNFIHTQLSDSKQFYKSLQTIDHFKKIKTLEEEAYRIYYSNKIELQKSVLSQKKTIQKLPHEVLRLKELWKKSGSYNVYYYYYILNGWFLELTGRFDDSIRDIESSIKLLEAGKINIHRFDTLLNKFSMIYALLRAKKYKKGLELAPIYLKDFNPYTRNWFAYMEHYFLLAMHAKKYNLASDIIVEVDQNEFFKRLKAKAKESWALHKAYLYFISPNKNVLANFNYQKFITSVPEHSKDKLGENIALHILQFLYHLKNKDYDQLYYKEGALRKYLSTYLKDPDSQRSKFFFRLLIIVIRADFNADQSVKKAQKWLEKLKTSPEPGDAYARIEVIPYERVWELIVGLLKDNAGVR